MTRLSALAIAALLAATPASAQGTLRIAMTASDIPTATGMPNNGFEGMRFMGYPIFEGLVLWDLSRADKLAGLRPGLAEKWEQVMLAQRVHLDVADHDHVVVGLSEYAFANG